MRALKAFVVLAVILGFSASAYAERGLGGIFTKRHLTQAPSSLKIIAGPETTQNLGLTQGAGGLVALQNGFDGGFQFTNPSISLTEGDAPDADSLIALNIGAVYGITDGLEVGSMFAPLLLSGPEGADLYQNPTVFATYGLDMDNFDIGFRFTGIIPVVENSKFAMNVGVPFLFRGNGFRIDSGLFVPINFIDGFDPATGEETSETIISLNIPVRPAFQINPNIFLGIETGFNIFALSGPEGSESSQFIPLGLFGGYTLLAGGRVIDIMASVAFDNALALSAEEPVSTTQFGWMRINVGANVAMKF